MNELKEIQAQNSWHFIFLSRKPDQSRGNLATDTLKKKQNQKEMTSVELFS